MSRSWAEFPFSPRLLPFFYGWVMIGCSVMAMLASLPGQTMGVGVFTDHLLAAWGMERTALGFAYMIGTLISGFMLPYAGHLVDKLGARLMMIVSAAGLGTALVCLGLSADAARAAWAWFSGAATPAADALRPFVPHLKVAVMIGVFLAMRFFGQGCLALVSRVVIGQWFNAYRGFAAAIGGVFIAFGFNYAPQFLNDLVVMFGWQGAAFLLAAVIGIGMSLAGGLLFRNRPEDIGMLMDGGRKPKRRFNPDNAPEVPRDFTRREALQTLSFWVVSLALAGHGFVMTAVTFHIADIGIEMGLSRDDAFALFLPMAFFSVPTHLIVSTLSDRVRLKYVVFLFLGSEIAGTVGLANLDTAWGLWTFVAGYGITGGCFNTLASVAWPRFFGRKHLGAISGLTTSIMVWSSALAPFAFSWFEELLASYRPIMLAYALWPLVLLVLAMPSRNPQEGTETHAMPGKPIAEPSD